ncbi:MAG: MFS transporter [Methanomassiliicoccales archaeon]|nr:MAG: MFS transporter [Methanomassiliicoccales archaeon]
MMLFLLDRGIDIFLAGTMIALYSGTVIILELPTGGLSDSIGRKKVYLISQTVYAIALVALLIDLDIYSIVIGMLLLGTARALSSGSIDAWFVDELRSQGRGKDLQEALAKANIIVPMGIAAGSLVGGLIPMYLGAYGRDELGLGIYDMNIVVMLIAVALQIIVTQILVVEHRHKIDGEVVEGAKNLPDILSTSLEYGVRNRTVLMLLIATAALGFSLMAIETYWQPRLAGIVGEGSDTWIFGALAAAYFVAGAAGNLVSIPVCSRAKQRYAPVLLVVRLLMASSVILLAFQDTLVGFASLFLVSFMMNGMESSPFSTIYNNEVPSERRSTLLSFQSLILQIGGLIGTFTLGYVAKEWSIGAAWTVAGAVLFISSLAYLVIAVRKDRPGNDKIPS